jgi:ABC-type transport system involved in multi-copper enzyme maturation permease subunit
MASMSAPGFGGSFATVFRLSLVRLVRGRKLRLGVVATMLVVIASIGARYAVSGTEIEPETLVQQAVSLGFFGLLAFLLPFLFAAGAISEEVEARTLPYLLIRPVSRTALILGKWVAAALCAGGVLVVGVLLLHVGAWATSPGDMVDQLGPTARIAGALVLLAFYYSAVCMFWGALVPEAGAVIAILQLAFVEWILGAMPLVARLLSMNHHASQLAGLPVGGILPDTVPSVELWICALVVVVLTLLFVALSAAVTQLSELGFGKA